MTDPGDEEPTVPATITDEDLRSALEELREYDPETIRDVALYAADLADWLEAGGGSGDGDGDDDGDGDGDDYPPGVPERATVTETEIAGTEYWYYQWREGDEIRSKTVER
ncbi:hypothetical protein CHINAEXTREME_17870 [Halobiforma lacisalsi AJ5]|uniref:Uncharacterized protein n=2 Tax=Natronobacterium TaxID=2256 RepID=M0LEW0_NATLA|nr:MULTISPECIES: hypothetical protein [Halobiforma]APW99520.1 hypothetical protein CHINAEXTREME_17870 [Halobiforma lacisalsi AJ5]EMA31643.1 hypothetical protein C445_14212 [Halobiforma lacisalsi AJ5]SFC06883.1 hypothetical protein SAMN05444422_104110 [Halobiforma haloterrestris]